MAKQKPTLNQADIEVLGKSFLTKNDAKNFATTKDIKKIVNKVVIGVAHTILQGVQTMFDEHNREQEKRFGKVENRLDEMESTLTSVKNDIRYMKDDVRGLKSEFSLQVSKKEFNQLKVKVDKYYPA